MALSDGTRWTYKYDAMGRRVEKSSGTAAGQTIRYVYGWGNTIAMLDGSNGLFALLTDDPRRGAPLSMRRSGTAYSYHVDALDDVITLTDSGGNSVEVVEYQAFGHASIRDSQGNMFGQSTVDNPFLYAGTSYDIESGFNHTSHRELDSELGRFVQEDPIGLAGGDVNLFAYVAGNPLKNSDPLGLYPVGPEVFDRDYIYNDNGVDPTYDEVDISFIAVGAAQGAARVLQAAEPALSEAGEAAGSAERRWGKGIGASVKDALGADGPIFGRANKGICNRNDWVRLGWSWEGSANSGRQVFRLGIGSKRLPFHWHWTIF